LTLPLPKRHGQDRATEDRQTENTSIVRRLCSAIEAKAPMHKRYYIMDEKPCQLIIRLPRHPICANIESTIPNLARRATMLDALRKTVCKLNQDLPRYGLVTWTSGNVSGRDPETGWVVIKPSGIPFEELTPENMVIVDVNGKVIEGSCKPSSDVHAHNYVYRHRPDVMGVVHTHSNYATAFAALGKPIPVYLTAMADEFGGPIPVGAYAKVGNDEIGREIVHSIGDSPAILMKNHGVFTVGRTPTDAVKAAVMVEDVARTVWLALQIGEPEEIPAEEVARARHRYATEYGQEPQG
jgi:L-ribulose-5-phosphate 4-epimerase